MPMTERRSPHGRAVATVLLRGCVLIALAGLAFGSARLSGAAPPPSGGADATALDSIPASLRAMIHPSTTRLPPFPNENPGLLDPGRWADAAGDSGMICALELQTYVRGSAVSIRSVRQRREGQSLSARYLCSAPGWRGPRYSGPFYVWGPHNELVERSYRTTDGRRYREDLYQYRENGLLWAYRHRERSEDGSGPALTLDEYFGLDGKLAGFQLERTGSDSTAIAWRRGARVDEAEFRKWAGEFAPK
jgi:hypothetical protein